MSFVRHQFWNGPPDLMFVHMQTQFFHNKKQTAQQALNGNRLQQALEFYTEALQIAQTLPHLCSEIPKILSNRSLVYYRQGEFQHALEDANQSIFLNPHWIKGYWRAAQAHKELRQVDCALNAVVAGYNVSLRQDQEEDIISFLVEIVSIIITLRYDPKNLLEKLDINPGSIETQRKLQQRLASNNCWEGISLLVLGVHAGPPCTLDAASSPVNNLSVGNLLKNTSIPELKRFGVDLAVCLLKSGASYEDIEQKMEIPVIHVGLKVALDTGNINLIKLMFSQYLKTAETKDALDRDGRTGFHVLVHSGRINESIGETLLRLLINNGCRSSISDRNGKFAINYLTPNDIGFNILSSSIKVAGSHVKVKINEIKEKGNIAFKNKEYKEALIFYNRAITMVKGYENLTREAAIVLTNRSAVHAALHSVTEALLDGDEAVRCDPTWMKGHWRRGQILRQKKLFRESFSAFLEGYRKGDGTGSEKCSILVEAVASFSNTTEKKELEASYKGLSKVSSEAWPEVLTRLSDRGEWAAIRYLVLGIDFKYINGQVTPRGVARDVDLQGITYNTMFKYLESHENPAFINDWITPLVLFLITQRGDIRTLLRFRASEKDTPLSAAIRFCVLTGDITLLQNMSGNQWPEMMECVDGRGDSPFHILFKMSRCPQGKLLATIVRLLLQKGVSPTVRDRSQRLPIDYVNPNNEKEVYDILRKYTQPEEREEQRQKQRQEQWKQRPEGLRQQEERKRQKEKKRAEGERRRLEKEEAEKRRHTQNKKMADESRRKESAKTLDNCESIIEDATKYLQENNMTHAYLRLANVLQKDHRSEKHKEMEKKALDIVINALGKSLTPEIPNELVKIPHKLYEQIIDGLATNERWRQMYFTVKAYRRHYGDLSLPNFAKSMSLAKVIRHSSFQDSEQLLIDVVQCMLNGGAVLDKDGKLPILAAVQECQFRVLEVLLKWGANPAHLTINQGDTPIHAALSIALERDKGNFSILKYSFDLYEKDPNKYPMLDPAQTNSDGDNLFHLVAKTKYNATTMKAAKLLFDRKVNASVLNKEGKLPKDYLNSKKDKRLQFLAHKEIVKRHIEEMINNLPDIPYFIYNQKVVKVDEIPNLQQKKKATEERDVSKVTMDPQDSQLLKTPTKAKQVTEKPYELADEQYKEKEELQIDPQVFDNLPWEVECTADVWKTLRDKKVLPDLKQRIIQNIHLLARGEWTTHLCKELRNTPPTIKLYEVKFSKASRIIWELAIAFSPRLSEDAEQRLQYAENETDQPVRGGRIYSEVIRVWDIVFDHDKIYKSVQRIIKSHSKGEKCIIKKKLKGVKQDQFKARMDKRVPMVFAESDSDADVNTLESLQRYYPPASSNETEYHILKFYNFDFILVSHVLRNLEVEVDFPFRVTHLEHSIINLRSNAPILLLGRSGTGKTTCCLYRIWSQFVSYWTGAVVADSKLIPRFQIFHKNYDVVDKIGDSEEDTPEEGAAPTEKTENKEVGEEDQVYDHLHQVFITKNIVLCSEVQKNFKEMSNACKVVRHFVSQEEQPLPHRIQDIRDNQFPIFITSKKLLLMLDASLKGSCFFERNDDGSLKVEVQGWAESDGAFSFLSMLEEGSDDEDEEDEDDQYQDADDSEDDDNDQDTQKRPRRKVDPRREVTYEVFAEEVWPWISKKWSIRYHPSLIWTEIMSFIKGSFEALSKPSGYLSKEEYFDLGRKRAPNFSGERENIYEIFKKYDHFKRQKLLFDEIDLVQNVFNRLKKENEIKWIIHQIYVDEVQDFTQAELCLLLRVCHSPNEMFLTGDTAQSIMRGISFRFEDLTSLFFYANRSRHVIGKSSLVKVPKKVHQLTHNYRSHAGILSLASSILDLLVEFFPESFDRLQNDQGLFQGPRPVLLESCSFSDLAVLLCGNKRKASHIEFGAHQAILVVNEAARDNIPEELNLGLILTIYEAKGLEFDDILLYNFFKDSQATKEWRVITDFLEKLAATNEQNNLHSSESLVSINADVFKLGYHPRPLAFDPKQHKVLNSELKHLYTAVTRARVNVWIFDEDIDKRAPMFEYFKARKLTRNVTIAEAENGDSVGGMFAEESSTEQWLQRGEEFMKHSLYEVAAKCFNRCKNVHKENIAKAHQLAFLASRMKDTPEEMKEAFLLAAEQFLECEEPKKAVICLQNSKEKELVAHLYEKIHQPEKAGEIYKKLKRPEEESRCYEKLGKFNLAVETLVENNQFEKAIETLRRYETLRKELDQQLTPLPKILIDNAPSRRHTVESLSFKAAEALHHSKNKENMMAALKRLPYLNDRTDFLIRKNYIEEAAQLYLDAGMQKDAMDLYTKKGMIKEALQCAQELQDKNAIGQSHVLDSKIRLSQYKDFRDIEEEVKNEICETLNQAFFFLQDLENKLAAGEAALLTGQLTGRTEFIKKAFWAFSNSRPKSEIGQLECMDWMVHNSDLNDRENLRKCVRGMQNLFVNLFVLAKHNMENESNRQEIYKFFGFYPAEEENKVAYYPKQQPRALMLLPDMDKELFICKFDKNKVRTEIFKLLVNRGIEWKRILEDIITTNRNKNKQCLAFRHGEPCKTSKAFDSNEQSCPYLHAPLNSKNIHHLTEYDMLGIELEMYVHLGTENVLRKDPDFDESLFISKKLQERYMACDWLLEDLIPQNYHNVVISSESDKARSLLHKLRNPKYLEPSPADKTCICVRERMFQYLKSLYDDMKKRERKDNIKVFVMIRIVSHLLNLEIKLEGMMSSFEDSMNKETMKKPKWAIRILGLMVDDSGDGKTYVRSIARRFCDGCDQIIRGNPTKALIKFSKFCALLSNTGSVEVLPRYNQLLLWMEYYTTVAFCLTAKVQNTTNFFFVLPESYIAVVYFIDAIFVQKGGVPTFEAVQRLILRKNVEDTNLFQERLQKLVDIVCGFTSNRKLNFISHIFQSVKAEPPIAYGVSGIAERLLVLVLVFVCNLGKGVNPVAETKLMSELCKIKLWNEYPSRLSEALESVQQAGSPADVAKALQILLSKRKNDSLACYIWGNFNKGSGLRKKELKTTELCKEFFFKDETLKTMKTPYEELSSKVDRDVKDDDEVDTPLSIEEDMEEDIKKKEMEKSEKKNQAANKITQFIRRSIFRSKLKNLSKRVARQISKEKRDEKLKVFESVQITNTGCGVCNVWFKEITTGFLFPVDRQTSDDSEPSGSLQPLSPLQLPHPNHEMVQQIQTASSLDKVMDNPFAPVLENRPMCMSQISLEDANQKTREEHEKSEKHKEMVKFQQHFRLKYMQEISDPLGEVRGFIQRYKLGSAEFVEKHFKEEIYNIGMLRRQRESVENKIENIIEGCDWQNGEIWREVQEMFGSYHLIKDYVETEARKRKERSEKQGEADSKNNSQQILNDDMEVIEPVVYKGGRRKGSKKKKGQRR